MKTIAGIVAAAAMIALALPHAATAETRPYVSKVQGLNKLKSQAVRKSDAVSLNPQPLPPRLRYQRYRRW